jgi:branched-chain amino acid transport system substrate-binding protein
MTSRLHSVFRRLHCAVGISALLLLAPHDAARAAGAPLEINTILPLTGVGAFVGHEQQQAVKAVEATVNATGGINGRPVSFVIADDQSNPQVAIQLVQGLRAKHVPLILGPSWAASCGAVLPLNDKDGPVTYCLSNSIRPQPGSFVFSALFSTNEMLMAATHYFRDRGWKRVAYIVANDATGQDAERAIEAALAAPENKDLEVVDREHFATTDLSVAAQMSKIKAANPQVLIAWAAGTPGGTLLHNEYDAGLDIPTLTSPANLNYAQLKEQWASFLPAHLLFPGSAAAVPDAATGRAWKAMVALFFGALGSGVKPDQVHASGWDPVMLAVAVLRKLGPDPTPAQIREQIAQTKSWTGVLGTYDFTAIPQRGIGASSVIMVAWDRAKANWMPVSRPGGAAVGER